MHAITIRAPTEDESRAINRLAGFDISSYGCLTLFFGALPVYVFGVIGGWMGSFRSTEAAQSGRVAGWIVAVGLFLFAVRKFARFERERRRRARQDRESQQVQEIHVINPRVMKLRAADDEPVLVFDIGENRILFLEGPWIRAEPTYGAERSGSDEAHEDFFNSLPPPHAFPTAEFVIVRLPHCGHVLAIRNIGTYVQPAPSDVAMERNYAFRDSELFAGRLEDIAAVLRREHQRLEEEASR